MDKTTCQVSNTLAYYIKDVSSVILSLPLLHAFYWRHDTQHNDTQHNDKNVTQHSETRL